MESATHTVPAPRPLQSLRRILRANGIFCAFAGVTALAPSDPRYPSRLGEITDAPPLLYVKSAWRAEDERGQRYPLTRCRGMMQMPASVRACQATGPVS